jgi:hypothetical protein
MVSKVLSWTWQVRARIVVGMVLGVVDVGCDQRMFVIITNKSGIGISKRGEKNSVKW